MFHEENQIFQGYVFFIINSMETCSFSIFGLLNYNYLQLYTMLMHCLTNEKKAFSLNDFHTGCLMILRCLLYLTKNTAQVINLTLHSVDCQIPASQNEKGENAVILELQNVLCWKGPYTSFCSSPSAMGRGIFQVAQILIQLGLEHFQGWDVQQLLWVTCTRASPPSEGRISS